MYLLPTNLVLAVWLYGPSNEKQEFVLRTSKVQRCVEYSVLCRRSPLKKLFSCKHCSPSSLENDFDIGMLFFTIHDRKNNDNRPSFVISHIFYLHQIQPSIVKHHSNNYFRLIRPLAQYVETKSMFFRLLISIFSHSIRSWNRKFWFCYNPNTETQSFHHSFS